MMVTQKVVIAVAVMQTATCSLAALSPSASGPNSVTFTNAPWDWREARLGALPDPAKVRGNPLVDEHGWHYGLAVLTPGGKSLWLDGRFGPEFEDLVDAHVTDVGLQYDYAFSPDGKHLAYGARQAGKCLMVLDGKPDQAADDVNGPTFSPDGRHLAYVMERQGKACLVLDSGPGPASDGVCGQISFSPDSRRIAYVVRHGKEYCLVVDQKEQRDWPAPGDPVFSPDSKHIGYTSIKGFAVLDGVKGSQFPANTCWGPVFSPDSRHFAYTIGDRTREERQTMAFVDWRPLPLPNSGKGVWHVVFGRDLKRWACVMQTGNKQQVVSDGRPGPMFDSAWGLTFSPAGARLAYMAQVKTNWWMVIDGKLEAEIELDVSGPCFSTDGKRLAYIAGRGPKWRMVVDGKPGPEYQGTREHVRGIVSGEQEPPGLTSPRFSPNSRHIAYGTRQRGKWVVLLDHEAVGGGYDMIVGDGPSFHEDGSLEFLGTRQGVLYRVVGKRMSQDAEPRTSKP
jgi:Tol biopolymer transport system component